MGRVEREAAAELLHIAMSKRPGVLATQVEPTWFDEHGREWKTPTIIGRMKLKIASHRALWEYVVRRDGGVCFACGGTSHGINVDHIISRRCGGAHHPENLQVLCGECNSRKVGVIDIHMPVWPLPNREVA